MIDTDVEPFEAAPFVADVKALYREAVRNSSPDNIQRNWGRIINNSVNDATEWQIVLGGTDWPIRHWRPKSDLSSDKSIIVDDTDIDAFVQFISQGGRDSAELLIRALQREGGANRIMVVAKQIVRSQPRQRLTARDDAFLDHAIRLERKGYTDDSLDIIYDAVDEMLREGKFDTVDNILATMDVESISVDLLIAMLTSTLPAKDHLPSRASLFTQIDQSIRNRGEHEEGLLYGLEG